MIDIDAPDATTSVRDYLADNAPIFEGTEDRIFGHKLPLAEAGNMPRPAVVLTDAGGFGSADYMPLDRLRIDVRSYGTTITEAKVLAGMVHRRLKAMRRVVYGGLLLHTCDPSTGYIDIDEPNVDWPCVFRSYLLLYDERPVEAP